MRRGEWNAAPHSAGLRDQHLGLADGGGELGSAGAESRVMPALAGTRRGCLPLRRRNGKQIVGGRILDVDAHAGDVFAASELHPVAALEPE